MLRFVPSIALASVFALIAAAGLAAAAGTESPTVADLARQPAPIASEKVEAARAELSAKYRREAAADPLRFTEFKESRMTFNGSTMRYAAVTVGKRPANGYPLYIAMHGGGGAPAELNDSQWEDMKRYYKASVQSGIYVATRGVSDDWNLHFMDESYPLYDRLIENMILFGDVDSNRVYLTGYSAGGDGVYQITARMPDRFAAANMSAGHHNGVSPVNLRNLPLCLQVGQVDAAYNRNKETVKYAQQLDKLAASDPGGYVHELFVHFQKPHNFYDNDPRQTPQKVLADPVAWLKSGFPGVVIKKNTNAIAWMTAHQRNPLPVKVVWNPELRAGKRTGVQKDGSAYFPSLGRFNQFYWLDLGGGKEAGNAVINATLDKAANAVHVETTGNYLRLLLSGRMLDLAKPVTVTVGGQSFALKVTPRLDLMAQTLLDRGDPDYIFESAITLEKKNGAWTATAP